MKKNKVPPLIVFGRLMVIVSTFFTLSSQSQATAATDYVTFNDGKVYVFPDSYVANVTTTEEIITFTALDGKTFTYLFSQIASVSQSPNKELP
ncbi:MAG: hypothetical protein IKS64_04630, partial [Muribaculaceae bacterium]|nr:hypothetical protein [Muribaculaceae bacterium]